MEIKIDQEKITLGEQVVMRADLSESNTSYVNRAEALFKSLSDLEIQRSEMQVLLNAYTNTLTESLMPKTEEIN